MFLHFKDHTQKPKYGSELIYLKWITPFKSTNPTILQMMLVCDTAGCAIMPISSKYWASIFDPDTDSILLPYKGSLVENERHHIQIKYMMFKSL